MIVPKYNIPAAWNSNNRPIGRPNFLTLNVMAVFVLEESVIISRFQGVVTNDIVAQSNGAPHSGCGYNGGAIFKAHTINIMECILKVPV